MTGTELVNIIKSPAVRVLIFGTIIISGAILLIPMLSRDEDPGAVALETELNQDEKAPLEIGTGIPRFKLEKRKEEEKVSTLDAREVSPPVISAETPATAGSKSENNLPKPASAVSNTAANNKNLSGRDYQAPSGRRNEQREYGARGIKAPSEIFIMSSTANGSPEVSQEEIFLSERYAPFGRLLDCKLVNTLESNTDGTPLIALVITDLWWTNSHGERKLIIPAGTEVHGRMGACVRNRMMCEGNFILIWQLTSDQVGIELQLRGRALEKSNQAGNKNKATITDMAAGIPGRVMKNDSLSEMLQYSMAAMRGLSAGFQTSNVYDNGGSIVSENDGSTRNALAMALESLSNVALENITDQISTQSYYVRVAAGTEFYLYIEQVTDISKAAIADTKLNAMELQKLSQEKTEPSGASINRASLLHDALGDALPKSLKRELKGIR